MARILLIGGTGLVGSVLQRHLVREGHETAVYLRPGSRATPPRDACRSLDEETLSRFDVIYNLAGAGLFDQRWSAARKAELIRSRVSFTEQLVQTLNCIPPAQRPKKLINASAVGFYGTDPERTFDETDLIGDDFLAGLCANWESAANAFEGQTSIARLGIVLSPEGGMLGRLLPQFRLGGGSVLGTGTQWISWIHIEDCARALTFLMTAPVGLWNLTSPQPVSQKEFADTLARLLKRPRVLQVPPTALALLLGEQSYYLLHGQRVLPTALQNAGFEFRFSTLVQALTDQLQ